VSNRLRKIASDTPLQIDHGQPSSLWPAVARRRGSAEDMGKVKERLREALEKFEDRERLTLCSVVTNVIYSVCCTHMQVALHVHADEPHPPLTPTPSGDACPPCTHGDARTREMQSLLVSSIASKQSVELVTPISVLDREDTAWPTSP
jgi:hypothetical protein